METTKKYELTSETIEIDGTILHQIKALKDFSDVKAGDLGGWIEKEENLSQMGDTWVYSNAKVYGNAHICNNAKVFGNALVCGSAVVRDNAKVYGYAFVHDNALICINAVVLGEVFGNAKVCGDARVHNHAKVYGNAMVFDNARVYGNARIYGNANVCGNVYIYGNALVYGDAKVFGNAEVFGEVEICGNAVVCDDADYIVFKNFWSSKRYFTWTRSNNMWSVGCFYGTGKKLIEKAYRDSAKSGKEYEKIVRYVDSILAYK